MGIYHGQMSGNERLWEGISLSYRSSVYVCVTVCDCVSYTAPTGPTGIPDVSLWSLLFTRA